MSDDDLRELSREWRRRMILKGDPESFLVSKETHARMRRYVAEHEDFMGLDLCERDGCLFFRHVPVVVANLLDNVPSEAS